MKATPRRFPVTVLTLLVVATVVAACGGAGTGPNSYSGGGSGGGSGGTSGTAKIAMWNYYFLPAVDTVAAGTKVTWTNETSSTVHTSISDSTGIWNSGNVNPGGSYSYTFNTAGTYPYYCQYHVSLGMKGTIVVK